MRGWAPPTGQGAVVGRMGGTHAGPSGVAVEPRLLHTRKSEAGMGGAATAGLLTPWHLGRSPGVGHPVWSPRAAPAKCLHAKPKVSHTTVGVGYTEPSTAKGFPSCSQRKTR